MLRIACGQLQKAPAPLVVRILHLVVPIRSACRSMPDARLPIKIKRIPGG